MEAVSNKEKAIEIIRRLPNDLTLHEIAYQLEMEQQLEKAQQDSDSGNLLNSEQMKLRFKDWIQ